jgi:hypothetical protein
MSFSTELENPYQEMKVFAKITAVSKMYASEWTVHLVDPGYSSTVYKKTWTGGKIKEIKARYLFSGLTYIYDEAANLADLETGIWKAWFYDEATGVLYIKVNDLENSTYPLVRIYHEYFWSSQRYVWHETPTDTATDLVEWEPYLENLPEINEKSSSSLLGYFPISGAVLRVKNVDQFLNAQLKDSTFKKANIRIWLALGDADQVTDFRQLLNSTCGEIKTDYQTIDISINSEGDVLETELRAEDTYGYSDFYNTSEFSLLDPNAIGLPKRVLFGQVRKAKAVNIAHNSTTVSETTNHKWGCYISQSGPRGINNVGLINFANYINYGTTTTTRIYFTDSKYARNFKQNDRILLKSSAMSYLGDPPAYGGDIRHVTNADPATDGYVDINAVFTFNVSTTRAVRAEIPRLYFEKNGVLYTARCFRDYWMTGENQIVLVKMISGYAATVGATISSAESVYVDMEDTFNFGNYGGSIFTYDPQFDRVAHPAGFLYTLLVDYLGIPTDEVDAASFTAVQALDTDDKISFVAPQEAAQNYPTYKDVINKILVSGRMRLFKNASGQWSVGKITNPSDNSIVINENDIISHSTEISTSDVVTDVTVLYDFQERGDSAGKTSTYWKNETLNNNRDTLDFYDIQKYASFQSYHIREVNAEALSEFLLSIFGKQRVLHKISLPREYINLEINELVTINVERIAGKPWEENTTQTITGVVIDIARGLNKVEVTIDDQTNFTDILV